MPNLEIIEVKNTGHMIHNTNQRFVKLIKNFLEKVEV
jgi:hypothetical protein